MMPIRDFFTKLFKKTDKDKPWLEYYSREEKSIKFTDKQLKDIKKLSKLLKISPHYFMRWCILATIKAYNNDGVYEDINVLED